MGWGTSVKTEVEVYVHKVCKSQIADKLAEVRRARAYLEDAMLIMMCLSNTKKKKMLPREFRCLIDAYADTLADEVRLNLVKEKLESAEDE